MWSLVMCGILIIPNEVPWLCKGILMFSTVNIVLLNIALQIMITYGTYNIIVPGF